MKYFLLFFLVLFFSGTCIFEAIAEDPAKELLTFSEKLEKGEPYSGKFMHPFTGEMMEKEIVGMTDDGKCLYIEEMPNGGKMECRFSPESRKAVAQYYEDIAKSQSFGFDVTISPDDEKQSNKYTINGKEVENPLQECLSNGECVISGY